MNQAGALVHLYQDGTVLVSHGGIEMGQGLHTKMAQIAADALGVPLSAVHVEETSTDKVANTQPTAASASTDLNGMAVLQACQDLKTRLAPVAHDLGPSASLAQVAHEAFLRRIDLSAHSFYATPDVGYTFGPDGRGSGHPFSYHVFGVCAAEVELDLLSGDHRVLRADMTMDVGHSINQAIDIGQIEGAFVQGYGLFVLEDRYFLPNGLLFTRGPGTYKIPGFGDAPDEFNVSLLANSTNTKAVLGSKGIGEPPLFLAAAVFYALKNAVAAGREDVARDAGHTLSASERALTIFAPATSERLRLAVGDSHVRAVMGSYEGELSDASANASLPVASADVNVLFRQKF